MALTGATNNPKRVRTNLSQVGCESPPGRPGVHRNRLGAIRDQEKLFKDTQAEFDKQISDLRKKVEEFGKRIALSDERIKGIKEEITSFQQKLRAEVTNAQKGNEARLKDHASDIVFGRLDALLGDRIGEPMPPERLREAREEARRRVEAEMPPGYMDRDKADPSGDYLVFLQVMDKAREDQFPVVLITDDEKDDWYRDYSLGRGVARGCH